MDSNRKLQEIHENNPASNDSIADGVSVLQAKINHQITGYRYRKLSAQDEIADLSRYVGKNTISFEKTSFTRQRIAQLQEEIDFCNGQIEAYQNNDNKKKIIPDRCL